MLRAFTAMKAVHPRWRMIVIAPRHVVHNVWAQEARKWSDFAHLRVAVLHGSKKEEALRSDADIYVINPDGLPWLVQHPWAWPEVLVVDESTLFKHPNTRRFKLLRAQLDRFTRRYILTGKPVPNGLLDLFGQIYILDGGERLGRFITHYRSRYFYQTGYGGYTWRPLPGASEKILEAISDITLRLDKREHLDLPQYIDNVVEVKLPAPVEAQVRKLERDFVVELAKGTVEAFNAAALTAKLRQMASGAVYSTLEDLEALRASRPWSHVHDAKLDALEALLAEREGQPTLVAYQFIHSAERIAKAHPEAVVLSWLSDVKVMQAIEAWNAGEVPLLLVHPASAAHGLNLQGGSEALVWFDPTYDLEHYDQLIARLWRQGQTKTVVNHLLIAADTVDEAVLSALRGKDRAQESFLAALKSHFAVP
jgi:SNF2 family DNA or RNA helicase